MKRLLIKTLMVFTAFLFSGSVVSDENSEKNILDSVEITFPKEVGKEVGLEHWEKIHEVFSHPRCVNCHVPDDNRPRWAGPSYEGRYPTQDAEPFHGMNVNGGVSRIGGDSIPCFACHQKQNSEVPHGPPGAIVWMLAPVQMQWWGKTSREICEQVKDPARNGHRSVQDVASHIEHDPLVHWGWSPGPGREPAPYSVKELVSFIHTWDKAGAPCP